MVLKNAASSTVAYLVSRSIFAISVSTPRSTFTLTIRKQSLGRRPNAALKASSFSAGRTKSEKSPSGNPSRLSRNAKTRSSDSTALQCWSASAASCLACWLVLASARNVSMRRMQSATFSSGEAASSIVLPPTAGFDAGAPSLSGYMAKIFWAAPQPSVDSGRAFVAVSSSRTASKAFAKPASMPASFCAFRPNMRNALNGTSRPAASTAARAAHLKRISVAFMAGIVAGRGAVGGSTATEGCARRGTRGAGGAGGTAAPRGTTATVADAAGAMAAGAIGAGDGATSPNRPLISAAASQRPSFPLRTRSVGANFRRRANWRNSPGSIGPTSAPLSCANHSLVIGVPLDGTTRRRSTCREVVETARKRTHTPGRCRPFGLNAAILS